MATEPPITPSSRPAVTVLMAVHNGERYLREAIRSVLDQSYADFEFLIVNDGSTDGSRDIALSFDDPRIRLLDNAENMGLIRSLNRGIEQARGRWIVRADADDVNEPDRIEKQIEWAEEHDLDLCFADWIRFGHGDKEETVRDSARSQTETAWRALFSNAYGAHPSVCYKRQTVLDAGAYDLDYYVVEDYDLWDRCRAQGARFGYLPRVAMRHRRHDESVTTRLRSIQLENTEKVSFRAMRRVLPELTDTQARSLRWLLWGEWAEPAAESQREGLDRVEVFVGRYCERAGLPVCDRRQVWAYVANSLFWRMHKMNGRGEARACARLWVRSALRAGRRYRFPAIRLVLYSFHKTRLVLQSCLKKR
ncbi:glycosyltransferase family 2 protein [Candidatus Sumerlaeota bacterium]|nr:glycosyltransferase family 2 protein [Candidatus Sumerlaeota bacterium]